MELYVLLLIGAAAFGGYLLGLEGRRSASGLMGTMLAALIFAVPMGFWLLFNGLAFALKGGRGGFRANDVREVTTLLLAAVALELPFAYDLNDIFRKSASVVKCPRAGDYDILQN